MKCPPKQQVKYVLRSTVARDFARVASGMRCKSAGVVPGFMIRLGDGTDSFGTASDLSGGYGAWPQLGRRFEQ